MPAIHRELAAHRWFELSLVERMAGLGSEIEPTISWRGRNERDSTSAFDRGVGLLDPTIANCRQWRRLQQQTRFRETPTDHFVLANHFGSTSPCAAIFTHSPSQQRSAAGEERRRRHEGFPSTHDDPNMPKE